jgi:hypothetical protein
MNKTFALLFHLKKPKNYVKGPAPIYIRVTIDGDRFEVHSTRECDPENWSSIKGRMVGNREDAKQLNNYLDLLQTKIYEAQRELLSAGYEVTAHAIKNKLVGKEERQKTILEVYKYHNQQFEELVGKEYADGTLKKFKTCLLSLEEFMYMGLFQFWNLNRFVNPISISRSDMMAVSKICSKATYHKVMKDLHELGFIMYVPSYNPFRGSAVTLLNLEEEEVQKKNRRQTKKQTSSEQALGRYHTKKQESTVLLNEPYINSINNINNKHSKQQKQNETDGTSSNFDTNKNSNQPAPKKPHQGGRLFLKTKPEKKLAQPPTNNEQPKLCHCHSKKSNPSLKIKNPQPRKPKNSTTTSKATGGK